MIYVSELICDICGQSFLGHDDGQELKACEKCQKTTLDELSDGKGEDDE
jgi:hypothetical protein